MKIIFGSIPSHHSDSGEMCSPQGFHKLHFDFDYCGGTFSSLFRNFVPCFSPE